MTNTSAANNSETQSHKYKFLSKPEYYMELVQDIESAGRNDRVALATMTFDPSDPGVKRLLETLKKAAGRGVNCSISIDAYIFLSQDRRLFGPLFFKNSLTGRMPKVFREKLTAINDLSSAGVTCVITNLPNRAFSNIVGGRSHIKFAVINELTYVGGCNLDNTNNLDVMVGLKDKKTADWLYEFSQKMISSAGTSFMNGDDIKFSVDSDTDLLIDSGKQKQSLIYDRALVAIDEAEKNVLLTCQFFPNSKTTSHLLGAFRRGVAVTILYNQSKKMKFPFNILHFLVELRQRLSDPSVFFATPMLKSQEFLHAKILTTEKLAIVGSHNYVYAGVYLGTAEIALVSKNNEFIKQTTAYANSYKLT